MKIVSFWKFHTCAKYENENANSCKNVKSLLYFFVKMWNRFYLSVCWRDMYPRARDHVWMDPWVDVHILYTVSNVVWEWFCECSHFVYNNYFLQWLIYNIIWWTQNVYKNYCIQNVNNKYCIQNVYKKYDPQKLCTLKVVYKIWTTLEKVVYKMWTVEFDK